MNIIKRAITIDIKDITFRRVNRAIVRRILDIPHTIAWYLPTKFSKENKSKLLAYKDKHKGQRCFIMANGPSLKKTDLSLLKKEYTIGMNRIYLLEKELGFKPNYLCVCDIPVQIEQFTDEYRSYSGVKFYNWKARKYFKNLSSVNFFLQHFKNDFSPDFEKTIGNGKSITVVCIQLAFYMGFNEVYLIGKDHSYNISGNVGNHIKANGNENNHFIKGYYRKGQKWGIPNYSEEEFTYKIAKINYENSGRSIKDATINGKLNVFDKIDFTSLF